MRRIAISKPSCALNTSARYFGIGGSFRSTFRDMIELVAIALSTAHDTVRVCNDQAIGANEGTAAYAFDDQGVVNAFGLVNEYGSLVLIRSMIKRSAALSPSFDTIVNEQQP